MPRPELPTAEDVRRALRSPAAYPHEVERVDVIETHVSHVYLAGDRVYKVKKPLHLPFVDASTPERRERLCQDEVRLNRRLAGEIYRGVERITCDREGVVRIGGDGPTLEVCVVMDRLPADRMLDALLERGEVDNELVERLVERLARFHEEAGTGPAVDAHGRPDAVARVMLGNLDELAAAGECSPVKTRHLRGWLERELGRERDRMARRVAEGRIREGHGDLHAGNVCVLDDRIVAYDCIEFEPAFRCLDVAAEIGFLTMDLRSRGFHGFAQRLARRYAEATDDPDLLALLPLYQVHYAAVRAKVAGLLARDEGADEEARAAAARRAAGSLDLAVQTSLPPFVALTCGLPGSGKSTAARAIGEALEAHVLRSDVERKRLAGGAPRERRSAPDQEGIYTPEWSDRVYEHLRARTEELLDRGRSVVVDASFPSAARREPFLSLARRRGIPLVVLHLDCSEAVAAERLRRRAGDAHEASDADERVRAAAKGRFEPPVEVPDRQLLMVRPDAPLDELPHRLVERLVLVTSDPPRSPS